MNRYCQRIAKAYWAAIPKEERSKLVPRNGGRPRIYPPCPTGRPHRFKNGVCKCGFRKPLAQEANK